MFSYNNVNLYVQTKIAKNNFMIVLKKHNVHL
jgi:hypothetical protein